MRLTAQQSYALLQKHGCYVSDACDKCGQILGPVRYTCQGQLGEWCSRACRDGKEAHTPGTCKGCGAKLPEGKRRGAFFCDDACKQAAHRQKVSDSKLSVTKPAINAAFCRVPSPGSYTHSRKAKTDIIRNADRPEFAQR
jgi:hypothetical protein